MKFGITVLGFDNLWVQAEIKPSSEKFLTIRAKGDGHDSLFISFRKNGSQRILSLL